MKPFKAIGSFFKSGAKGVTEGAIKGTEEEIRATFEATNEAITNPVGSGQAKPQPGQGNAGAPGGDMEKKQQEEVRKRNLLDFLRRYQTNEQSVAQKRMHEEQVKKQEEGKLAEEKKIKQFEIVKQQNQKQAVYQAQRKTEAKPGGK